jgi:hypothetical protein
MPSVVSRVVPSIVSSIMPSVTSSIVVQFGMLTFILDGFVIRKESRIFAGTTVLVMDT